MKRGSSWACRAAVEILEEIGRRIGKDLSRHRESVCSLMTSLGIYREPYTRSTVRNIVVAYLLHRREVSEHEARLLAPITYVLYWLRRIEQGPSASVATVTVKLPRILLDQLDQLVREGIFASRSEAIREGIRLVIQRHSRAPRRRGSSDVSVADIPDNGF